MEFIREENRFYHNNEEGRKVAEITWQKRDDVLYIDHTFTDPALRGQGIAGQLVDEVVKYARDENLLIMPVCPYVVDKFNKDEQYQDIDFRKVSR